jgi:hypothetical protein
MTEQRDPKKNVPWLLTIAMVIITGLSIASMNMSDNARDTLTAIAGNVFADYCSDKGGVIETHDVHIFLDDLVGHDVVENYTCADNADSGVLVVDAVTGEVVYYIKELKE